MSFVPHGHESSPGGDHVMVAAMGIDVSVHVFSDVANKWTRTRRIWNESSYQP